jgi:tyrosyl-tRNA synthetase
MTTNSDVRLLAALQSRGLLSQTSDEHLDAKLTKLNHGAQGPIAAYAGFDPTSDSLHVGNYIAILGLMHAQRQGVRPIAVVGGATGLIGDPGGKTHERALLTKETVAANAIGIRKVLEKFLDFNHPTAPAMIVNNVDWFGPMSAIDFLRDVGKHFRIGSMLAKDSVKSRMDSEAGGGEGMSYTEFSYQLLQGYDFYRLYKDHRCVLQIGGSDQWGNITAGTDLVRKMEGESGHAFAVTMPLITDSTGKKFGKSEGNAVWLSAEKTSAYEFFQFWLRVDDNDAERFLKYFTFLGLGEIDQVMVEMKAEPHKRAAQKCLAEYMTKLVHGDAGFNAAMHASEILFGGAITPGIDPALLKSVFAQVPTFDLPKTTLDAGISPIELLKQSGLSPSNGEARKLIAAGGFYVNNNPWTDISKNLTAEQLITPDSIVLRSGKKNYRLVRVG